MSHDERLLELISALVDGELSPDEQTRAHQVLASSPDLRQYHDELLALRKSLQSLPRFRIGDNFSQQVLRRAEREMLLQPKRSEQNVGHRPAPRHKAPAAARWPSRKLMTVTAAVITIAATITVAVIIKPWSGGSNVVDHRSVTTNTTTSESSESGIASATSTTERPSTAGQSTDGSADSSSSESSIARVDQPGERQEENTTAEVAVNQNSSVTENAETSRLASNPGGTELQMPMYALVYEVVLTNQGIQENAFQQSLVRNGIDLHSAIAVDRTMEGTLLAHRYFGGVKPEDLPADTLEDSEAARQNHLEIFFLVCTGPQFDLLALDLNEQANYVVTTSLDMTSARSDMMLYEEMQKLAQQETDAIDQLVGAHPLALEEGLRERLVVALRESHRTKDGPPEIDLPIPPVDDPNAAPEANPAVIAENMMEQKHMVLVVLRSPDTVTP